MSAQLAAGELTNRFSAHLVLAAGVTASIHALSLTDLQAAVAKLQPAVPANDPMAGRSVADVAKLQTPASTPAPQPQGNASASTGTQASAPPAASGSGASGEQPAVDYKVVQAKVLALSKLPKNGREIALATLGEFTGVNGQKVDHGNKLQLHDYPAFVAAADKALAAAGAPA